MVLDDGGERPIEERLGGEIPLIAEVGVAKDAVIECLKEFGEVDIYCCVDAEGTWVSHGTVVMEGFGEMAASIN